MDCSIDYLFMKIVFFSISFGWVFVNVLTATRGILDRLPMHYPKALEEKPLGCAECLSGWVAWIASVPLLCMHLTPNAYTLTNLYILFLILITPFVTILIFRIIDKIIQG